MRIYNISGAQSSKDYTIICKTMNDETKGHIGHVKYKMQEISKYFLSQLNKGPVVLDHSLFGIVHSKGSTM